MPVFSKKPVKQILTVLVSIALLVITWNNVVLLNSLKSLPDKFAVVENTEKSTVVVDTGHEEISCIDLKAVQYNRVEDIYCTVLPKFLPNLKNPCFYILHQFGMKTLRCLPYFYIIGMDKSGSTDLYSRLAQHSLVYENLGDLGKETQFWSWNRYGISHKKKGLRKYTLEAYMKMFVKLARIIYIQNITNAISGDASPMDIYDFRSWTMIPQNAGLQEPRILTPHLMKHVHHNVPPKFIIIIREPIERLYSDYVFLEYGNNTLDFHHHVVQAIKMMEDCLLKHSKRFCFFDDQLYQQLPVRIHVSCYSEFLKVWLQVFPRSAFHIFRTREYTDEMETTLRDIFTFLQLPQVTQPEMKNILRQKRRHITEKKTGTILPETKTLLRSFYSGCNEELASILKDERYLWLDHYS
ncbi:carbohydrate sulfotransferase 15 [Biomphalaria pfeifferi]|uniref:Carbohydrate sulfotransferase 15 n=1 Tax=Biomphalaria pfeifferi TaxID=112525 RepID=A0AAD8B609_BIOPF|nr:carbohydrate sulfotransferase 15 [Biomphalaria pfeifferi]